jgi:hypothetical protein
LSWKFQKYRFICIAADLLEEPVDSGMTQEK